MSLLSKGIKEGAEAVDEAAEAIRTSSQLLADSVQEASISGSRKAKEIADNLTSKYNKHHIQRIARAFVENVFDITTVDSLGNKKLTGGTFKEAAEATAEKLNNLDLTYLDGEKLFPGNLTTKEVLDLKTLDNIRAGEGGKQGVDNFLDVIKQYFRVATRPKSLSSEYMGSLGDQKRLTQLKAGATTLGVGTAGGATALGITELLSDEEGKLTTKQKNILKKYDDVPSDSSSVTDIRADTVAKAFSIATKNPSEYIFINEEGLPSIIYKGEEIPANLATNEKKTEIMLVPIKKAMGGSMLSRQNYQEGGSLMVPPEMEGMAEDMPVDTYPNIPPEEMAEAEASQLPDVEMEDKYMDFVVNESLDNKEQSYLMNALEADPMLSQIFDKVITTASEFTGAGEVEGPGTGVSDSIPARLSDGEFVFTKKATDQMGSDNLQMMMDDAERAFDGGEMRMPKQRGGMMYNQKDEDPLAYEKVAQDEIKKSMLKANRAPSLLLS